MALNRCPACKASVLDDDATQCPFCGASMSASAGGTTSGKTTAAASKPQRAPASQKKTAKADDPFGSELDPDKAASSAIALAPKPMKGRRHEVVCPMCETVGFAPSKASGSNVKCRNSDCMVPVFKAPRFAIEPEPEPESKSSGSGITFIVGSAVLLLAVLGGAGWFVFGSGSNKTNLGDVPPNVQPVPPLTTDGINKTNGEVSENPETNGTGEPTKTPAQIREEILERTLARIPGIARDTSQNLRKQDRRRDAALAFAAASRADGVMNQIEALRALTPPIPYFEISPLVASAWSNLEAGDRDAALPLFTKAAELSDEIPQRGPNALDAGIDLAALAIALSQDDVARKALESVRDTASGEQARYVADRAEVLFDGRFDKSNRVASVWRMPGPAYGSVAYRLAGHGDTAAAYTWAATITDPDGKIGAMSALAEVTACPSDSANDVDRPQLSDLTTLLADASPGVRAFVLSRAGRVAIATGANSNVAELVAAARTAADDIPDADAPQEPTLRSLTAAAPPNPEVYFLRAAALAELAKAEADAGDSTRAEAALDRLFAQLRGSTPAPTVLADFTDRLESVGTLGMRSQLASELNISSDTEARNAVNDFRRNLRTATEYAKQRSTLAVDFLAEFAEQKNADFAQKYLVEMASSDELGVQEPLSRVEAGWTAASLAETWGMPDIAAATRPNAQKLPRPWELDVSEKSAEAMAEQQWRRAAEVINKSDDAVEDGSRWRLAAATAFEIYEQAGLNAALDFTLTIERAHIREAVLVPLCTHIVKREGPAALESESQTRRVLPTDRIAMCLGIVRGISESNQKDTPENPDAESA
ncbi:zinc ribbon domain-containing protein [Stratiformator vulcanicus]|uniref:Uncharacterized protein n=1 Tax=Stratiformator vulcanicus TaxID=2527980 RepID=A0A517R1T1_9PLAN|nr:zinc ribbon domain-containing protein [Stratiformator vulcanicus]QDT37849.1 hypothetical protein Pan189_22310 [Stratiformator vulcanicus]